MKKCIDLQGKKFGRLVVVSNAGKTKYSNDVAWLCVCECGKNKNINGQHLRDGTTKSCGCLARELSSKRNSGERKDITGKMFGQLKALSFSHKQNYRYFWKFQCDCGKIIIKNKAEIIYPSSEVVSCGCYCKKINKQRFTGEKNPNWIDRKDIIAPSIIRTITFYGEWRKKILKRDNYCCVLCQKRGGQLEVDHIKPFAMIIFENKIRTLGDAMACEELWNFQNARTLCRSCHLMTKTRGINYLKIMQKKHAEI